MKVLVANLGSTSFKYCLFEMDGANSTVLTKGGYERVLDYGEVIEDCLKTLHDGGYIKQKEDIDAVGFKTVLGKNLTGCVLADEQTIKALEGFKEIAPAHNPAYANGIRLFGQILPEAKLVALFETAFYQWIPEAATRYAVPKAWHDIGIRRYGFHGASHKFIAERSAELLGREDVAKRVQNLYVEGPGEEPEKPLRVISCHLGGSSSITGIRNGLAIGTSMGLSPQSGLPQNNRVGDLDSAAIPYAMRILGLSLEEVEKQLTKESGLLGVSGVSNDHRDITEAATNGNENAQVALDLLVKSIRHWAGAYFFEMGGAEAIVFTGGIGENSIALREQVCAGLEELGLRLDTQRNGATKRVEGEISAADSRIKVFVIPANEELIVARETERLVKHLAQ